jgi:hypothetical protein
MRFVAILFNGMFVMTQSDAKRCHYIDNNRSFEPYDIRIFDGVLIQYAAKDSVSCITLSSLLKRIPFHRFADADYIWNHDINDRKVASLANPFKIKISRKPVDESSLPPSFIEYFKSVLCSDDNDAWVWLRSYLANIIHNPNTKTRLMLILYSHDHQLGKSTLKLFLNAIMGSSNVAEFHSLSEAFGQRGAPTSIGKRVVFCEELVADKSEFRACKERMKISITEQTITYRPLYSETRISRNTNCFIACTNNLIGILPQRMTVLNVSNIHQNDHIFYNQLRKDIIPSNMVLLVRYLSRYITNDNGCPMTPFITEIQESMRDNSKSPLDDFIEYLSSLNAEKLCLDDSNRCTLLSIFDEYKTFMHENYRDSKRLSASSLRSQMITSSTLIKASNTRLSDGSRQWMVIIDPKLFN